MVSLVAVKITLSMLAKCAIAAAFMIDFLYTPEIFPTTLRFRRRIARYCYVQHVVDATGLGNLGLNPLPPLRPSFTSRASHPWDWHKTMQSRSYLVYPSPAQLSTSTTKLSIAVEMRQNLQLFAAYLKEVSGSKTLDSQAPLSRPHPIMSL